MVNFQGNVKTKSGLPVRNLKEEKKNCNCSLGSSNISGQVFVNGSWHISKWTSSGTNISGISGWDLVNY